MKFIAILALAIAAFSAVHAQKIPACANDCEASVVQQNSCNQANASTCVCTETFHQELLLCLSYSSSCTDDEAKEAQDFYEEYCAPESTPPVLTL
ncbi:hypothetical protein C8Q74DRAFT_1292780, partial [Fomes fomentarius]